MLVPVTVVLEPEWVLRSGFEFSKADVLKALSSPVSAAEPTVESERALEVTLQLYRKGTADFADCLHAASATQSGEQPLRPFDRRAAKIGGARLLAGT
jgi:predicted nucleic-acid-binding protein